MRASRTLVLWADAYSANLGVRVLAEGAAELSRRVWPENEIVFQDFAPNSEGFSLGRTTAIREVQRGELSDWLRQFAVILDTGAGDSFSDLYGMRRLAMLAFTQLTALRAGVPLILLPQTIGPYRWAASRVMARRTLRKASAVFARDSVSAGLASSLGSRTVDVASDLVFGLKPSGRSLRHDVILNVSGLIWNGGTPINATMYQEQTVELIQRLCAEGRSVSLLAHVLANASHDNDAAIVGQVVKRCGADLEIVVPDTLGDARTHIAGANVVVGARMHACLNALSQGVPAIAWAYSRKFKPLMNDLGWPAVVDLSVRPDAASQTLAMLAAPGIQARADAVRDKGGEAFDRTVRTMVEWCERGL